MIYLGCTIIVIFVFVFAVKIFLKQKYTGFLPCNRELFSDSTEMGNFLQYAKKFGNAYKVNGNLRGYIR